VSVKRILVVDDERPLAEIVDYALRRGGYAVVHAANLAAARAALRRERVDLLILDLGLPDGDGLDLCRELRQGSRLPILILSSRDEEVDRVLGLEIGADDYVVKPFSPRELVARVRSILRRAEGAASPAVTQETPWRRGRLELDRSAHRVRLDGRQALLTPTEFELLATLLASPERVFSRDALVTLVYDGNTYLSDRTIDSHVKGIRRRFAALDPEVDPVETVFGVGYRARIPE
jgi:two-component system OmpR family response regulator